VPEKLHERTPLIIGSKDDVALVESFVQQSQKLKMKEHNGSKLAYRSERNIWFM